MCNICWPAADMATTADFDPASKNIARYAFFFPANPTRSARQTICDV